jgi:hypothetical protein
VPTNESSPVNCTRANEIILLATSELECRQMRIDRCIVLVRIGWFLTATRHKQWNLVDGVYDGRVFDGLALLYSCG